MSPDRGYPERAPRRYAERPRSAGAVRASQRRRYSRGPIQSTKALTVRLTALAVVGTLLIGGLIAAQMAAGNDPALGPKAVARANKASTKPSSNGSSTSSSTGSGTDPYTQTYGGDGNYYYGSPGDNSGSSGYSSGSSGYSYSPPPVTSSTS
ncbi:MAG: hypothetical protein ACM33U_13265 [Solirubrobacterales bacterium]|nr:hypothetical protein [Solirubrobacterales bacterium]